MSVSWLLFKKSGRQSVGRLGLTVLAIGLGTLMLLSFLAGINGLTGRMQRMSWADIAAREGSGFATKKSRQAQTPIDGVAPLQIGSVPTKIGNTSMWRDKNISQIILHATGENSPELPGLKTPGPGEYYLSPGLEKIARENPEYKIGERYGTKYLGTIPARYVQSPDSLEVISGATAEQLAAWQQSANSDTATKPVDIYTTESLEQKAQIAIDPSSLIIFGMGGTILLFPIVMFVAVATQLGSTQREQRYAALRLIGATKNQINRILLFESFIATAVGIVLGSLAFLLVRGQLTHFKFGELGFWPEDLNVTWLQYIVLVALTLGLSLFASWRAMRKVRTSPLGVARRETLDKKPRFWRILPLMIGVGVFVWISTDGGKNWIKQNPENMMPMLVVVLGIVLVMFGLVIAGSWLTSRLSQLFARRTNNAATLLASRRIAGHSRKIFRSVSGLVLALFAGSFYLAAVSGIDNLNIQSIKDNGYSQLKPQTAMVLSQSLPDNFVETLRQQSYITSAATVRQTKDGSLILCRDLATYTKHSCPSNANENDFARLNFVDKTVDSVSVVSESEALAQESFPAYLVALDDSASIDKLRSLAIAQTPVVAEVYVADGTRAQKPVISPVVKDLAALTYVGIGITLFVAVASLVVSTIGGLLERRRSLFTLRLGGMTLGQMKRVVLIESLIPLIGTSVLAAGAGIWVSKIFLEVFSSTVRVSLSPIYFVIVIGSMVVAIIGIWLVLPILKNITSLEQNQTE